MFATSAYGAGGGAVKLSRDGSGGIKAEEVWFSRNMENHHGGVLVIDGALYGANGGNGGGYLACLDFKSGEVLWNERDSEKRRVKKGSMIEADGRIYYRTEEGPIVLIENTLSAAASTNPTAPASPPGRIQSSRMGSSTFATRTPSIATT